VNVTVAVVARDPLDPVIVTGIVCRDVNVHEIVEVPLPVTLKRLREHSVVSEEERPTTPLNPLKAVTVIVEVPAALVFTGTAFGFAVTENPTIWKRIEPVERWTKEPPIVPAPVTVTM
jgi:hypothetical protein